MQWVDKYKPKSEKEVVGQESNIAKLKDLVLQKKNVLIYGGAGNGKTSCVYALAKDLQFEVIESNASDYRTKEGINSLLGSASSCMSLFKKGKIILIDEVDSLSFQDRGGAAAIAALLKSSSFPIVLIASNPWGSKLSGIRKGCELIEFKELSSSSVYSVLKSICEKEGVEYDEVDLKSMARRSSGDLRAAINDLQTSIIDNKLDSIEADERERTENVFNALLLIFKSKNVGDCLNIVDKLDIDFDELTLWLDENLPNEYSGWDLARAYDRLSKADVFKGRIRRWQYWRYFVYQKVLMSAGIALAKREKKKGFVGYRRSNRILKMYIANIKYAKRKAIAGKLARAMHIGERQAIEEIEYLRNSIIKNNDLVEELELSTDEVKWLHLKK